MRTGSKASRCFRNERGKGFIKNCTDVVLDLVDGGMKSRNNGFHKARFDDRLSQKHSARIIMRLGLEIAKNLPYSAVPTMLKNPSDIEDYRAVISP